MTNEDVALEFEQIADLLEIKGESAFRVNNYRRAARTIDDLDEDLSEIAARNELPALPGVGKSIAAKIQELLDTGAMGFRAELTQEVPETVLTLLEIPGLGPKKAAALWQKKSIATLDRLKTAIEAGELGDLKGFGKKTLATILSGIEFLQRAVGRTRLGDALEAAADLCGAISKMEGVTRVEQAGSLRRGCETAGNIDLLCRAENGKAVVEQFTRIPGVSKILAVDDAWGSVLFEWRPRKTIQVDLRVASSVSFGPAWQYFTGSKTHNARLARLATERGLRLDETALVDVKTKRTLPAPDEEAVYRALDLPWIPPELREDRGEFEPGAPPADLLRPEHIRGDLHMHTVASDGRSTVEEMAEAARALGYQYICITDHSQSSTIANGLTPERLEGMIAEVREVDRKIADIEVWIGTEVDIRADGSLDYEDELLARLDFVVASIHSGLSKDLKTNTDRTIAAIHNPYVNAIGHPTGRMINARKPMQLDIEAICREAAAAGAALEINAGPYRLDLKDEHARLARDLGAMLVVCTDAHGAERLDRITYGVTTARRAWLRKQDVLNTRSAKEIKQFVQAKRT